MITRIRDPIHNFITLNADEVDVIGTPCVQRLRGIKQLALASLIYPGALHTRFDHSLGVAHVAGLMADAVGLDSDEKRLVRLAALLHDVGHGPFSHVSEAALELFGDRESLQEAQKKEKIHELVTAMLIQSDIRLGNVISESQREKVVALLSKGYGSRVVRNIVSGPIDADKQDYLLRDSRFCGVEYGRFDLHQLHRSLTKGHNDDELELMIRNNGVHALEQFILAKYYMTADVYRHKGRIICDQMIVRAIVVGVDIDENEELRQLYRFDNSDRFVQEYAKWDDSRFLQTFGDPDSDTKCSGILNRLRCRSLLKRVLHFNPTNLSAASREIATSLDRPHNRFRRREVESVIADCISHEYKKVDPHLVIVHSYSLKSAREMSRNDERTVMIDQGANAPSPFEKESMLFSSIDDRLAETHIDIFAPIEWKNHDDRERLIRRLEGPLVVALEDACQRISREAV